MPAKVSPTLRVLFELRDEQRRTNARLDALESSLAGELRSVGSVLVDVRDLLRDRLDVRDRVEDHERRIASLERAGG